MKCKICDGKLKNHYRKMFDDRHGYPGKFKIYKCEDCGFMQTSPQLTFRELTKIYTNYYPKRDADIKSIVNYSKNIPPLKVINSQGLGTTCHFQTKKGQKVLDVGCGTCQSLLEIKMLGGEAWGIDPDKNSENVAKKLRLKFHLGTIHNALLPEKSFDLITASQVLEHEGDPIKFLKACKKYLKAEGKILLSFPNTDSFFRKVWGRHWLHWHIPYHLNHFNRKSVKLLANKSGLKIESLTTVTPNLWTILQIRQFLNKPKIGMRDPLWDVGSSKIHTNQNNLIYRLLSITLIHINKLMFFNRIVDKMGFGESFVVTLSYASKQYS